MNMRILAVALFLALCSSAFTAELLHKDGKGVIPNKYIIVLKDNLSPAARAAHILALKQNMVADVDDMVHEEVTDDFAIHNFHGFFATLSDSKLGQQLAHPNVKYIEADKMMSINYQTQAGATWGLARSSKVDLPVGTNFFYNNTYANPKVDCYIVDTGILTTHTDFGGRVTILYNAIVGESGEDLNGHGTHVAGTVAGARYGFHKTCPLFAVKVLGKDGSGSNSGVIKGIESVAIAHRKTGRRSVANMSLGGTKSTATDAAVDAAVIAGVAFAVAAGNDNKDACNYSPAAAALAVTVGATTSTDDRSSFSNYGRCVNLFAPGSAITSDWIGSNDATNTISGTSMASPHVCGVLALHREVVADAPAVLSKWIISVSSSGKVKLPGTGSPNQLLYSPYV